MKLDFKDMVKHIAELDVETAQAYTITIGAGGDGPNKYVDLDTKKNLASPRWAMEATLDYLDKNYNGIDGYLDSIGFTKEWRAKLN